MIDAVLDLLRCPRCAARFEIHGRTLRCAGGHVFDVARQGYVNLIGSGQPMHADVNLGIWALHVWHERHNPRGIFADWNPNVNCDNAQ